VEHLDLIKACRCLQGDLRPGSWCTQKEMNQQVVLNIALSVHAKVQMYAWAEPAYIYVYKYTITIIVEKLYLYIIHVYLTLHL
jgi:hypothetical protein